MERDFRYLRDMHGDAGAREIFEKICSELLHAIFLEESHPIRVSQGDGGIDILVGDFSAPIINHQCKYFIDGVDETQRAQIRNSFRRSITSTDYKMKKWVLCIPCTMSLEEFKCESRVEKRQRKGAKTKRTNGCWRRKVLLCGKNSSSRYTAPFVGTIIAEYHGKCNA